MEIFVTQCSPPAVKLMKNMPLLLINVLIISIIIIKTISSKEFHVLSLISYLKKFYNC